MVLLRTLLLSGDEFQGDAFQKKRNYDFCEISTPDLCCSFMGGKPLRACHIPPRKSTWTNRMGYYLPDQFVLIGCRHRTDSMQPEKNSVVGIGRISVWAHFLIQEDVTGRPNRNKWGILWRLTCQYLEVDTFCAQDAVAVLWHAQKVIVRSDLAVEAQDYGWTETRIFT